MVESQKVKKLQSLLLVFLSKQPRKEKSWMLAKNQLNQEKIIKIMLEFRAKRFRQELLGFNSACLKDVQVDKKIFSLTWLMC